MAFFVPDQELALRHLFRNDPDTAELLDFLKGSFDDFVTEKVAPRAAANDRDEVFALDTFKALGETGLMSMPYAESLDGMGANFAWYCAGLEMLSKADAGFTLGVAIHGTATDGIARFGSEELKRKYVPALSHGRLLGCFGLSEANSGSDAKSLKCAWVRDRASGDYVLSGTKYWITNGMDADVFFVMARGEDGRISSFVVERGGKGTFEQHKILDKMGVRGSNTAELLFDGYHVPKANLVGEEGKGFNCAMHMLNGGRITISAFAVGIAQGAYEKFIKYAHERELFGKRLVDLDNTKREISEMATGIVSSRLLSYAAAFEKTAGGDVAKIAAMAKVNASEVSVRVAERAIELAGGYGYVQDSRIERHLRDALLARIGEGANEVLNVMVIPRALMAEFAERPGPELW